MAVLVDYLHKDSKSSQFVYRRRIPAELQQFAGKNQVRRLLGSASFHEPKARVRFDAAVIEYCETVSLAARQAEARRRAAGGIEWILGIWGRVLAHASTRQGLLFTRQGLLFR